MIKIGSNWTKMIFLVGLVFLFALMGCEGKKGATGPSGTAECILCHSDDTSIPRIAAQWENSKHASGETIARSSSSCSRCHTSEGFVEYVETESSSSIDEPSAIGCFTCHAPHTDKNFDLRTEAAYTLENNAVFDYGKGNLCANCHHSSRDVNTYITDPETFGSHWGPHHSVQADMLAGENGYEYSGYTADFGDSYHTSALKTLDGCVACHMEHGEAYTLGGHSWNMEWDEDLNLGPCNIEGCHKSSPLVDFNHNNAHTIIEAYLDTLGEALVTAGLVDSTFHAFEDSTTSADSAGAIWNLLLVEEDRSHGCHNADYAIALLKSALMHMRGEL